MPRDHRGDFGTFIGIHRERLGKNQPQIAAVCTPIPGQSRVSDWETGKAIPEQEGDVRAIARELEISEDFLVQIWQRDLRDRNNRGDHIVTRTYNCTSEGGGTSEDPY